MNYPQTLYTGNVTIDAGVSYASTSAGNYIWTSSGSNGTAWTNPVTITQKATLDLNGEGADVVINGESLNQTLKEIKEALRIPSRLNQDHQLEKEWEELQQAAEHYNKLLQEYREKQKVWDTLKDRNL
jgi:hypothetical protein